MLSLNSKINISPTFTIDPKAKDEDYGKAVKWYGEQQFSHVPKKNRYMAAFNKLKTAPREEVIRWKLIAEKNTDPRFRFNCEFKNWRLADERASHE